MTCKHENFNANVKVNRFEASPGVFHADINISCQDCGTPLEFVGLPNGVSFYRPTVDIAGLTMCAPLVIQGGKMPRGMPGMSVSVMSRDATDA